MSKPACHLKKLHEEYAASRRRFGQRLCEILKPRLRCRGWNDAAVLDVGCGDGLVAEEFAARGATVVAIDAEFGRVGEFARRLEADKSGKRVRLVQANGRRLPFSDQTFDVALLSDVLEHVMRPDVMLTETARVLKPGGMAYIATTNRWSILNSLADPHYNIPAVNLMPRPMAEWYVTRLARVSREYGVGWYFSKPWLRRLIAQAGLSSEELQGLYEEKIRAGNITMASRRGWLKRMLVNQRVRQAAIGFARTSFFNLFVQPGWEFLALRPEREMR